MLQITLRTSRVRIYFCVVTMSQCQCIFPPQQSFAISFQALKLLKCFHFSDFNGWQQNRVDPETEVGFIPLICLTLKSRRIHFLFFLQPSGCFLTLLSRLFFFRKFLMHDYFSVFYLQVRMHLANLTKYEAFANQESCQQFAKIPEFFKISCVAKISKKCGLLAFLQKTF